MENNNNNSFENIFYLNKPFPKSLNLLDNFRFISYGGFIFPRIRLAPNSLTLEKIIYSPFEVSYNYNLTNKLDFEDNNTEIQIEISKEDDEGEIMNYKNDNNNENNKNIKEMNYSNLLNEIKEFKKKKNLINENMNVRYIYNDNNKAPTPPQSIISLLNDNKDNINSIKNNIENINKIILNNINMISTYNNILIYDKEKIQISENKNQINNQAIINTNLNNSSNNKKDKEIIKININKFSEKSISKPLFEISSESLNKKNKKRGRKVKNSQKKNKIHSASDDDNLLRKIQVHFLSFIIFFVNDIIRTFINIKNPPLFKNLDYKIKKKVNYKYFECLKSKKISEIIQLGVSPKMKVHDKLVNTNIYNKICKMCPFFSQFLEQSYLSLFNIYYYNKNSKIEINGREIQLSLKTKTFIDLIRKYDQLKDKLKYVAINYFINSRNKKVKKDKTNIFKVY